MTRKELKEYNDLVSEYNNLYKENKSLKEQLEEKQNPLKGIFAQVNDDTLLRDCGNMNEEINELKNQQKEFIAYLEDKIKETHKTSIWEVTNIDLIEEAYQEILSKYKEIIGDDK